MAAGLLYSRQDGSFPEPVLQGGTILNLTDQILQQLSGPHRADISRQLGIDEQQTRQALPAAVATLTGAMADNAARPEGAQQLAGALSRDHDGSILDALGPFLGSGNTGPGAAILGHILSGRQNKVESNLGRATGLDPATIARLLALIAPIVLGMLGRQQRQKGLDSGGLTDLLGGERQRLERDHPQAARTGLGALLDADGDGQILDDLAGLAGGFLGGGRRK